MMYAAFRNHADVVRVLIQHGADMALMDDEGMTALLFAIQGGDVPLQLYSRKSHHPWGCLAGNAKDCVQILLSDKQSLTSAAERGYSDMGEKLLALGVGANTVDVEGNTALLRCAMSTEHFEREGWEERGEVEACVELLITNGSNLEAIDRHYRQTALGWAIKTCKPRLADLLRHYGADIEAHAAQHFTVRGQSLMSSAIAELCTTDSKITQDSDQNSLERINHMLITWPVMRSYALA